MKNNRPQTNNNMFQDFENCKQKDNDGNKDDGHDHN